MGKYKKQSFLDIVKQKQQIKVKVKENQETGKEQDKVEEIDALFVGAIDKKERGKKDAIDTPFFDVDFDVDDEKEQGKQSYKKKSFLDLVDENKEKKLSNKNKKISKEEKRRNKKLAKIEKKMLKQEAKENKKMIKELNRKNDKNKKNKKVIVVALALVAALAVNSTLVAIVSHFKKKNNVVPQKPTTSTTIDIGDIGTELEFPEEGKDSSKYGETTGNIDKDKLVEKDDKIYVDQESADKSDKVGSSSIDTKNDTLVEENGKVQEKNEGYEIKDSEGNVVDKGNLDNDIPEGYAWDSELKKYLPKEEVGKYVYADTTYYDDTGIVIISKGDVVTKETLEKAKKYLVTKETTQTTKPTTTTTTTTPQTNQGIVNADGTYTIFGVTYEDKATFEQIALSDSETIDVYVDEFGVIHIKTDEKVKQLVK